MNQYWYIMDLKNPCFLQIFLRCYLMSFFLPLDPIQNTLHLGVMTLYAPPHCERVSSLIVFWWSWEFWGILISCFVECPSISGGVFFLLLYRGYGFRREIKLHSHCITSRVHSSSTQLITVAVSLDHLAEGTACQVFHCKITPLPCPNCTLWKSKVVHLEEDCKKHWKITHGPSS